MSRRLKEFRIEKGYPLDELAKLSGISVSYMSELENGSKRNPSLDIVHKIARALNTDIVDICYAILEKEGNFSRGRKYMEKINDEFNIPYYIFEEIVEYVEQTARVECKCM